MPNVRTITPDVSKDMPDLNLPDLNLPGGSPTSSLAGISPTIPPAPAEAPIFPSTPQAGIVDKMSGQAGQEGEAKKSTRTSEGKQVRSLANAIRILNDYADDILETDEANSRTVRKIISVLGEILKGSKPIGQEPGQNTFGANV